MHDIMHRIEIDAPTERLYAALTSRDGLASWWTPDVELKAGEGGEAVFGFDNHDVVIRMRIDRLVENERVEWRCEGEVDEWTGTRVLFELSPAAERCDGPRDRTVLTFTHSGWRSVEGKFRTCNTDWGRLMYYLKDHAEGRGAGPMMGQATRADRPAPGNLNRPGSPR